MSQESLSKNQKALTILMNFQKVGEGRPYLVQPFIRDFRRVYFWKYEEPGLVGHKKIGLTSWANAPTVKRVHNEMDVIIPLCEIEQPPFPSELVTVPFATGKISCWMPIETP